MVKYFGKAISLLWTAKCNIYTYKDTTDDNGITQSTRQIIAEEMPCRVSYESDEAAKQSSTTDNVSLRVKLFIDKNIPIVAGSEITVTQNGVVREYVSAGLPAVYSAHQEVSLMNKEEYA